MAQPLDKFAITEVRKPKVGENKPAAVTAEITINTAGEQIGCRCFEFKMSAYCHECIAGGTLQS